MGRRNRRPFNNAGTGAHMEVSTAQGNYHNDQSCNFIKPRAISR